MKFPVKKISISSAAGGLGRPVEEKLRGKNTSGEAVMQV